MRTIHVNIRYFEKGSAMVCSATLENRRAILRVTPDYHNVAAPAVALLRWEYFLEGVQGGWHTDSILAKDVDWYSAKLRTRVARHAGAFYREWMTHGCQGLMYARAELARIELDETAATLKAAWVAFDHGNDDHELFYPQQRHEFARDRWSAARDAYVDSKDLFPSKFAWKVERSQVDDDDDLLIVSRTVIAVR